MEIKRRPFQGALNILSFNRHFYVYGIIALVILFASRFLINWPQVVFWIIIAAFLYGLIMPLLVSAYVYDFSGFYKFDWLNKIVSNDSHLQLLININAGFDETSFIIHNKFPQAHLRVFDFYDATRHTEPAIIRARKVSMVYPDTRQIQSLSIPVKNNTAEIVFLISAVHEIRSHDEKIQFLKVCHKICKPDGQVIMVEHLRDFPNFEPYTI